MVLLMDFTDGVIDGIDAVIKNACIFVILLLYYIDAQRIHLSMIFLVNNVYSSIYISTSNR